METWEKGQDGSRVKFFRELSLKRPQVEHPYTYQTSSPKAKEVREKMKVSAFSTRK
jgi:hypothetical protein